MIYVENTSTNPFFNFALEYYLINEKQLPDERIFIFWRTKPTLMIGRYQNTIEEINEKFVRDHKIDVVRRITGGGTIYTDLGGWQFSFITKGQASQIDFTKYISPIIDGLKKMGVKAEFNSRNDLVIKGKKISGNAQCMANQHTLHHGSLLYDTDLEQMIKCIRVDEHKIVSKGIKSVRDRVTNISDHLPKTINELEFKEQMVASIMDGSDKKYQLRPSDIERINAISKEKFENWEWNYGRSPKFNITKTGRFDGGKMEFKLDVNKGIIRSCHIYGDFFGSIDISKLSNALINRQYKKETIKKALAKLELKDAFYHISVDDLIDIIC